METPIWMRALMASEYMSPPAPPKQEPLPSPYPPPHPLQLDPVNVGIRPRQCKATRDCSSRHDTLPTGWGLVVEDTPRQITVCVVDSHGVTRAELLATVASLFVDVDRLYTGAGRGFGWMLLTALFRKQRGTGRYIVVTPTPHTSTLLGVFSFEGHRFIQRGKHACTIHPL